MSHLTSKMQQILISSLCLILLFFSKALGEIQITCENFNCGHLGIHFPFGLKDKHPDHCIYPGFVLSCNEKYEAILELPILFIFHVKSIDYKAQRIQLYDPENCLLEKVLDVFNKSISPFFFSKDHMNEITFFNCSLDERNSVGDERGSVDPVPCLKGPGYQVYSVPSSSSVEDESLLSCTKMYNRSLLPYDPYQRQPANLYLEWSEPNCGQCERQGKMCSFKNNSTKSEIECFDLSREGVKEKLVAVGASLGSFCFLVLLIAAYRVYRSFRKQKENQLKIERFLDDYRALKPSRYSYADIKRITNNFKDKLGEGAYGTVFKGNLSSELFVAVKLLNSSKGNGEEFINEVSTMGHIHHVNVVRMVGFCADGFRRALVYDYLPNGSLQNYISTADNKESFLGWEKLEEIALAIAKGIEYLHQGCDQRILHFDIKPHNVLLDQNLTPKICDFGLAKLSSKDKSIVSMTTARGTLGYIAPEVFSRNFGNVSYKSDVYSFGMLLLEIVGGRKNVGPTTENANEIYYPEWIYNLLEGGDDQRIDIGEGDGKISKKLAIVGLWCIQWQPVDRPSMKAVVQMLEGGESYTMPPNPFASTGPGRPNARNFNLQLEAIAELE